MVRKSRADLGQPLDELGRLVTQALHAASFGLTFLATLHFLREITPSELQASAQGFYVAIGLAPLSGLISLLSGWLYDIAGGRAFFAMAACAALGTALAFALPEVTKRSRTDTSTSSRST